MDIDIEQAEVVQYTADFFTRYEPDTALDMVLQLPGFQIDDGGTKRGFGAAAGNILINDRRASAKQDAPSAILRRVPAKIVERIELIRGQVRGLDLQGQSVLANVILRGDAPAAYRWDASVRKHSNVSPLRGEGSLSVSDHWKGIDYTAGVSGFHATFGDEGTEDVFDANDEVTERRFDDAMVFNDTLNLYLNASTWLGETLLSVNTALGYVERDETFDSLRIPVADGEVPRDVTFGEEFTTTSVELGVDAERSIGKALNGRAILLYYESDHDQTNDERVIERSGDQLLYRVADSATDSTEAISRLEFDWSRWNDHLVQVNFEAAYNALDNALWRADDTGQGPVVVDVPGANTKVEELRGDVLVQDTWTVGDWTFNYGLGWEISTITQSGDAELERTFRFFKPQVQATWAPGQSEQTRLRVVREVAQLDFSDFVSATVFLDDDLALGNPDLEPESTWVAEMTHERRFGELTVASLTGFHHWISDVQDLLPITDQFEAPGNIGDGRRWGVEVQSTVPLGWMGLANARLDVKGRWQDSTVTDPVTEASRVLTAVAGFNGVPTSLPFRNENDYAYAFDFRQDFERARMAWGWSVAGRAERPRFKVNELDVFDEEEPVVDLFVETTRWLGLKINFTINNLLDLNATRNRIIYAGRRDLSPVALREYQQYSLGRRYILEVSGSF